MVDGEGGWVGIVSQCAGRGNSRTVAENESVEANMLSERDETDLSLLLLA